MSPIHEVVDGVVPDCSKRTRSPTGMAPLDAQLIQQIHDGPAQWTALALLQLDRALGSGRVVDARLLDNVRTLLNEALRSIRYVLEDGHDNEAAKPSSLAASLLDLGRRLVALTGLALRLECDDRVADPPALVMTTVLLAAQELLLNTCKHAPGAKAEMSLEAVGDGFELKVCDDGPGFDPVAMFRRHSVVGGLGLGTMPERLAGVGGAFSVHSCLGAGVRACIRWPGDFVGQRGLACGPMRVRSRAVAR